MRCVLIGRSLDGIYGQSSSDCTCGCRRERCYPSRWVDRVCVLGSTKEEAGLNGIDCLGGFGAVMMESRKRTKWSWSLWGASCHHFSQFFLLQHFWNPVGNTSAFCPNHFHVSKWSGSLWGARCHHISLSSTAAVPCLVRFLTLILGPDCTMYNLTTDRVVRYCCQIC